MEAENKTEEVKIPYKVGDTIEFIKDGVELEGKLISIKDGVGRVETKWGIVTTTF